MKIKGQHRGHCQACGRIQVVESDGYIAKHGYNVKGGYFSGTCGGSGLMPLEVSRIECDSIIADLRTYADESSARAQQLRDRIVTPSHAVKRESWGGVVYGPRDPKTYERQPVMIAWADANSEERRLQIELNSNMLESRAKFPRSHADMMQRLADRVFGSKLIDRDAEELARVAERKAKREPIEGAYRTKAAQKADLEKLNRDFSKLSRIMIDGGMNYMDLPFDLHNFNQKRLNALLAKYPAQKDLLLQAAGLYAARELVKSRPVIK